MKLKFIRLVFIIFIVLSLTSCRQAFVNPDPIQPAKSETVSTNVLPSENTSTNDFCSDYPENAELLKEPFHKLDNGEVAGYATLSGKVKSRNEDVYGETVEIVYFMMEEPRFESSNHDFYNHWNEENISSNPDLQNSDPRLGTGIPFRIGIIENSDLSTTASISDITKQAILNSLENNAQISLTFSIPRYIGRGAPANFSFACMIE